MELSKFEKITCTFNVVMLSLLERLNLVWKTILSYVEEKIWDQVVAAINIIIDSTNSIVQTDSLFLRRLDPLLHLSDTEISTNKEENDDFRHSLQGKCHQRASIWD